jgi:hypothetical protein
VLAESFELAFDAVLSALYLIPPGVLPYPTPHDSSHVRAQWHRAVLQLMVPLDFSLSVLVLAPPRIISLAWCYGFVQLLHAAWQPPGPVFGVLCFCLELR